MTQTINVALDKIEASPTNPRRTFHPRELDELAASIVAHGIVQPPKVRPHPTKNHGTFQLIVGERRWRAARIAGLAEIPVIVEDLTDIQVREQQLVENSQRVDITELEEADAYQALLEQHGYTMDDLVAKTGRSRSHLYSRIQLLNLSAGPRTALAAGKLSASVALMIARIPNAALQEQACKEVLGEVDPDALDKFGVLPETIAEDGSGSGSVGDPQPLSFRAARALILRRYSLKLSLAKFDPADATLVSDAGSCASCIYRSGNQPELALPGVGKTAEDLCTNPPCHEKKTQAAWTRASTDAEARGLDVVEKQDADKMFSYDGTTVLPSAPYVDLDTPLPYELDPQPGSRKTFGKLLGKKVHEVPHVLVQDGTGAARELLDKTAAIAKLRELGKVDKPTSKPERSKASPADKEKAERAKAKREINEAALRRALGEVAEAASKDLGKKETAFWRWVARGLFALVGYGDADVVAERRELAKFDDLAGVIEKAKTAGDLRGIVAELLACLDGQAVHTGYGTPDRATKDRFEAGLSLLGVKWDEHVAAAKDAARVAAKAEEQTKAKKGGKKS